MSIAPAPVDTPSVAVVWIDRARFVLAVGVVWALLHALLGTAILPRGLERPIVLAGSHLGPLAGMLAIPVIWLGAAIASWLRQRSALVPVAVALAVWAAEGGRLGGTMDQWLLHQNEIVGLPSSRPYWPLLVDYIYLALALAGTAVISALVVPHRDDRRTPADAVRRVFRPDEPFQHGALATLTVVAVGGLGIVVLTGSPIGRTYRGQVYFAVILAMVAGVFAATHLTRVRHPVWYWPAPLILGFIGALVAALEPTILLPENYDALDTIPAWGLVRPLPIELAGVGIAATLGMLSRSSAPQASTDAR